VRGEITTEQARGECMRGLQAGEIWGWRRKRRVGSEKFSDPTLSYAPLSPLADEMAQEAPEQQSVAHGRNHDPDHCPETARRRPVGFHHTTTTFPDLRVSPAQEGFGA